MLYSMGQAGIRVCLVLNSLIIIVTRKVLRWHRLKCCMAESVGHHCFGIKQGKVKSLDQKFYNRAEKQVQTIRQNLKVARSRQKSYADTRRRDLVFDIGDFVYLKVSPMRGVKRFHTK